MKMVEYYIDGIEDEICSAVDYAEKYIEYKVSRVAWAKWYHDMAMQEIAHATYFKDMGTQAIDEIKDTYISNADMEAWTKCMKKYAEKMAMAKMMLNA